MKWFEQSDILAAIDPDQAITAIEQAFRDYSAGRVQSIAIGHLNFDRPPGDFHVKGAHVTGRSLFAVKMASSFYENPDHGLPSSNGMMIVFDARTGEPLGALLDNGALTDLRTAIAGGIVARLIAPDAPRVLGVIGAGTQAALQAAWIARMTGIDDVRIWARKPERAQALAGQLRDEGLSAVADEDLSRLCARADLIVTTTPAREPILDRALVAPGSRIIAIGADASGKRELARDLVDAADLLLVDSRAQCAVYGESAGAADPQRLVEVGDALAIDGWRERTVERDSTIIADLTGIGVQDAAIAELAWTALTNVPALQKG